MKSILFVLVLLICSVASAQWSYVPLERSIPYQMGYGRVYPNFGPVYYRGGYYTSRYAYPEMTVPMPRTFTVYGSNGVHYWGSY